MCAVGMFLSTLVYRYGVGYLLCWQKSGEGGGRRLILNMNLTSTWVDD